MILSTVTSKNGVLIRLTHERWNHIITSHLELDSENPSIVMNTVKNPDAILKGDLGELLAVKKKPRKKLWIVVPYKEVNKNDGFILTAYLTSDANWLFQRETIWNKE